ncbi:MAG: LTA synthase family protein [Streptococcaceae bacterium]|jgi:lipoteichoic acid synthase|nr:LTA synthase family protein [Streptococcaceae bacterium]
MKKLSFKTLINGISTRTGLIWFLVFFIWLKTILTYLFVFQGLHSVNLADYLLMLVNPIGFTAIFLTLPLFIKRTPLFYTATAIFAFLGSLLVYANVLYYREFSDFLSINTLTGGAGMLGHGFDYSSIPVYPIDSLYWVDLVVVVALFAFRKFKMDNRAVSKRTAFKHFSISLMIFLITFWGGDLTEHRLVSRQAQFDDTYVVRYLGLGPWLVTNGWYTHVANQARSIAKKSDFTKVQKYIEENRYLAPNTQVFGVAKNRNVIMIHLESFQQDLIDKKIDGVAVTPFLNSLYHSNSTYAFSNFWNQVGQGKTSDAENMLETSSFGLPTGSLFQSLGSSQTFQAMPAILNQQEGYSSAVFHGNVGSFYNRINVYRNMGFQNFFDQSYWNKNSENSTDWGIKDKYLFSGSIQYLEQLQQPFYAKYLTLSNHTPYTGLTKDELDTKFKTTSSPDQLINNYFLTAHYLDQSVEEFFNYLKASGLYSKSIIVLYGDHYGISGSTDDNAYLPYLGKNISSAPLQSSSSSSSDTTTANNTAVWTDYDNVMMQRVPFMINIPGHTDGGISNEYGGELDVMPTLEHLLGVDTKSYMQFGQDLLSQNRQQFIALRNRGFVTSSFIKPSGTSTTYYDTKSGQTITPNASQIAYLNQIQTKVNTLLNMSDAMNSEDLLRFYTPTGFTPVDAGDYSYNVATTEKRLKEQQALLKAKSTSLLSENHGVSTTPLYKSTEPGLVKSSVPSSSSSTSSSSKGGTQ